MDIVHRYYRNVYRDKLRKAIESYPRQVFMRNDLTHEHSNQAQLRLNRALKMFVEEGFIIKISHGLYAKAEPILQKDGKFRPLLRESFESVAIEALNRLGVKWEFGTAIREYNEGKTTQVPVNFTILLKSRFRGEIRAEDRYVVFEGGINAR